MFIVGAGRSGTTLLMQMFDHHPRFAFPWESHFIPVFHRHLSSFGDLRESANRSELMRAISEWMRISYRDVEQGEWIPDLEKHAPRLAESCPPTYSAVIDTIYSFYAAQRGRERWGDKTPNYISNVFLLGELFPGARFVHLVRDGRDVAASVIPLSFGPKTAYTAAVLWRKSVETGLEFARRYPGRMFTLHYEDLVEHPEKWLRLICAFLGEEYSDEMLRFHEDALQRIARPVHHQNVGASVSPRRSGRWKRDLSRRQVRVMESVAGDLLAELGYKRAIVDARTYPLDRVFGTVGHWIRLLRPFTKPLGLCARIRLFASRMAFNIRRRRADASRTR